MAESILAEIRAAKKPFYIYLLLRPNGTPFYCGKGQRGRILRHETEARSDKRHRSSHRLRIIRKIWKDGGEVGYQIDSWHDTESSALQRECELIAKLGRSDLGTGPLANRSTGGDQPSNGPEACRIAAEKRKQWRQDNPLFWAAAKEKAAATLRTPESRRRSQIAKDMLSSEEVRKKLSESRKRWNAEHPEEVAAALAKQAEIAKTPEYRAKLSAIHTKRYENPEEVAKQCDCQTERWSRPEERQKQSERRKRFYQENPERLVKPKLCLVCGVEYRPGKKKSKYCSTLCSRVAIKNDTTKACEVCGAAFRLAERRKDAKYCTAQCRIKAAKGKPKPRRKAD